MKIIDVENATINQAKCIAYIRDVVKKSETVAIMTLEYWNQIGNTTDCTCYCKRYLVLNMGTVDEEVYEDKTTIVQSVRAKKW